MNISIEEKKNEALRRMARLGIIPDAIKQFKDGHINVSEPPLGTLFWTDDEDMYRIRSFEKNNDALVYMVVRSHMTFGKMDSFLYVSDHKDEWGMDNDDIGHGELLAYVYNHDNPDLSELGYIGIKRSVAAGLIRIW